MEHVYKYIYIKTCSYFYIHLEPNSDPIFLCGWLSILRGQFFGNFSGSVSILDWASLEANQRIWLLKFWIFYWKIPAFQLGRTEHLHVSTRLPPKFMLRVKCNNFPNQAWLQTKYFRTHRPGLVFQKLCAVFWIPIKSCTYLFLGGWTTHLKNMLVKLDHFLGDRGKK